MNYELWIMNSSLRGLSGSPVFWFEEPGFFFLKVLISVRIGPADVRQLVEVYFQPAT